MKVRVDIPVRLVVEPGALRGGDELDHAFAQRIFPAIGARNIHPTEPVY